MVLETREMLCELFHFNRPPNAIFTMNIIRSLNFLKKGLWGPGDHVLVSAMAHNALMRPLTQLADIGVTFTRMPCSEQGELLTDQLDELVRPNTKAMILLHASNVCGTFNATGSGECLLPKAQVAFFAGFGPNRRRFPY